jgi:hypothetical protein
MDNDQARRNLDSRNAMLPRRTIGMFFASPMNFVTSPAIDTSSPWPDVDLVHKPRTRTAPPE